MFYFSQYILLILIKKKISRQIIFNKLGKQPKILDIAR